MVDGHDAAAARIETVAQRPLQLLDRDRVVVAPEQLLQPFQAVAGMLRRLGAGRQARVVDPRCRVSPAFPPSRRLRTRSRPAPRGLAQEDGPRRAAEAAWRPRARRPCPRPWSIRRTRTPWTRPEEDAEAVCVRSSRTQLVATSPPALAPFKPRPGREAEEDVGQAADRPPHLDDTAEVLAKIEGQGRVLVHGVERTGHTRRAVPARAEAGVGATGPGPLERPVLGEERGVDVVGEEVALRHSGALGQPADLLDPVLVEKRLGMGERLLQHGPRQPLGAEERSYAATSRRIVSLLLAMLPPPSERRPLQPHDEVGRVRSAVCGPGPGVGSAGVGVRSAVCGIPSSFAITNRSTCPRVGSRRRAGLR